MAEYLSEEEQIARLQSWWAEWGKLVVAVGVAAIVGFAGWQWYQNDRAVTISEASDAYAAYIDAAPGSAGADALAADLAERWPNSSYAALMELREAALAADDGDYEAAEEHLDRAAGAAPDRLLKDVALIRHARVLHQLERTDAALAALSQVRSEGYRALVAELKGDIHMAAGERELARESYQAATDLLGDGDERPILAIKLADASGVIGESTGESVDEFDAADQESAGDAPQDEPVGEEQTVDIGIVDDESVESDGAETTETLATPETLEETGAADAQ